MLKEKHIGVVPGSVFGNQGENSVRISFGSINPLIAREAGERMIEIFS